MTTDKALDLALEALEIEDLACRYLKEKTPSQIVEAITAIKQARSAPVQEPDEFDCGVYLGEGKDHAIKHHVSYKPAQQEPVDTLIEAWQALEETSGHVLDVVDVEGRMHMSVIRSAWEQMDSLVREMWDKRGRL
jgi:hypothetical protein